MKTLKNIFSDYTNTTILLLVITTFSGALRKWAGLPGIINNISLLILMSLPLYLLFYFKSEQAKSSNKELKRLLQIFIFMLIALAVHPLNLTLFHGILGFFVHLTFIAIILSYLNNKDSFKEDKIIKLFFIILITQVTLGVLQSNSSPDSFINRYADNRQTDEAEVDENVSGGALVGNAVRVTGTFSYLGGYTAVLFFLLLFSFYLSKTKDTKYIIFLAPLILFATLLSGSRGSVGFSLILLGLFFLEERKSFINNPKPFFFSIIALTSFIFINISLDDQFGVQEKINKAYENFMIRFEGSKEEGEGRLTSDLIQVFTREFKYKNFGVGLGSTYQGANALFGTSDIVKITRLEGELFRLVVEGGIYFVLFRWLLLWIIFKNLDIPPILKWGCFIVFCFLSPIVVHIYNAIYISLGLITLNQAYYKKA